MTMRNTNRLYPRQWLVVLTMAGLAIAVMAQHQHIDQLELRLANQARLLELQQEITERAVSHLELVRKYNIPYRYLETLASASEQHGLNLEFMVGLMRVESSFNPNAQSHKSAYGLMQVRYPTALELDPTLQSYWQLFDPERNIWLGTAYFRKLLDRYEGDYRMASLAYNRGPTRLDDEILSQLELSDSYYRKIRTAGLVN
jgi:soluble lytic murein transglycosylase-like protein